MLSATNEELLYLADQQAYARSRYHEDDADLIRESLVIEQALRLSAQQREPVVRVKELKWTSVFGRPATRAESLSSIGLYIIADLDGTERFSVGLDNGACAAFLLDEAGNKQLRYSSIHEAAAAAQADYEQRIMAAIEIVPAPAGDLSQAKATEGKAGMAGVTGPVRRSTAGTGLRVGEAGADQPATSEFMDVTAGRDRQLIQSSDGGVEGHATASGSGPLPDPILGTDTVGRQQELKRTAGIKPGPSEAIADGCCSSISPCQHQRSNPTTICDTCKAAHEASGRSQPSPDVSVDELADWLLNNFSLNADHKADARALLARYKIERLDRLAGGRR